jgi:rRNA maturation protein Nop10
MDYCRDVCRRKNRYAPANDRCPECGREWTK